MAKHISGSAAHLELVDAEHGPPTSIWTLRKLLQTYGREIFVHRSAPDDPIRRLWRLPSDLLDIPIANGFREPFLCFQQHALKHGNSPHTVNDARALVAVTLRFAYQHKLIDDDRHNLPRPLAVLTPRWRPLTLEESRAMRNALALHSETRRQAHDRSNARRIAQGLPPRHGAPFIDQLEPIVLLVWETGLWNSEWPALEWGHIDFGRGELRTRKRRRIPLTAVAQELLLDWHKQRGASDLVFPPARSERESPAQASEMTEPIVTRRARAVSRSLARLVQQAGLQDIRLRDLRVDLALQLQHAGVSVETITIVLGHPKLLRMSPLVTRAELAAAGIRALDASRAEQRVRPIAPVG